MTTTSVADEPWEHNVFSKYEIKQLTEMFDRVVEEEDQPIAITFFVDKNEVVDFLKAADTLKGEKYNELMWLVAGALAAEYVANADIEADDDASEVFLKLQGFNDDDDEDDWEWDDNDDDD